ncbi:ABC transporter substrate-binding protein [Microbacterium sp. gxy059]|uniref:ABC transporter substrate-binding protein n=1 Tax=Microbacterium sp. gxy059 TaxID=2957199 RepID=UPI003D9899AC
MASSLSRRSRLAGAAIALVSAVALASCGGAEQPGAGSGSPDPDASLAVGLVLEPTNLDIRRTSGAALEQALIGNVYEGLVARGGEDEDIVTALASEWTVSDDGLAYTFTLHEGVTFHDGATLEASDVVASLTAVQDDEQLLGHDDLQVIESISAPDDLTVEITLSRPDQNLLFALTGPAGLVFDEDDDTDMKTDANGTGPFSIGAWRQGDSLALARFDDYWGDPAGVAEAVLTYIPDQNALVSAGLDGSLDAVTAVDADLAPQLEGSFELSEAPTTDKFVLAFNLDVPPLDDIRVREALRLAIDHDAILEVVGAGSSLFGPIPEPDPGYEDLSDVAPHDPERARELLADAGAEDLSLTLTIPSPYGNRVSTLLASQLQEVGVTLDVQPVEFSTWLQDVYANGDYELSYVNHVEPRDFASWADPDYYYGVDEETLPEVQDLYEQAMSATDADASAELLAEAARLVSENHPVDWLYAREDIVAVAPGIEGFPRTSTSTRLPLAGVTVEAP